MPRIIRESGAGRSSQQYEDVLAPPTCSLLLQSFLECRTDIETWSSEQDDSAEVSATADDFKARQRTADEQRTGCSRSAALASKLKLRYITSQAQLQVGRNAWESVGQQTEGGWRL